MSLLGSLIQSNPQSYFFALSGGGAATTLQSPAVLTPDSGGNTTLALNASGSGASALSVNGSAAGSGTVTVGGYGTVYRAAVLDPSGVLQIGLNSGAEYPAIIYDSQTTHQLVLGDRSAVSSASIQTNQPLIVRDYNNDTTGVNGIALLENSTTSCTITNVAASGGILNIGSSQAFNNTLQVSDIPKNGAGNYIEVNGASGQVPLFISGAQGAGGASYIYPDSSGVSSALFLGASRNTEDTVAIQQTAEQSFVDIGGNGGQGVRLRGVPAAASVQTGIISSTAGASGQLQLQGSSGSANAILISDTTATFDQQIVQQVAGTVTYSAATVLANATYTSGTSADFNVGTFAPGLYMCMIRVNQANVADPTTMANMGSGLVYLQTSPLDPTKTIVVGGGTFGNGNVAITSIATAGIGADTMRLSVTTGNVYVNVKMWQLTDVLPGMST